MRFIVKMIIPAEAGNKMVEDPNFIANVEDYIKTTNAEQAYFLTFNGDRTSIFVIDIPNADMLPLVAEPLFRLGAKVEFYPVMTFDDLKKGISSALK